MFDFLNLLFGVLVTYHGVSKFYFLDVIGKAGVENDISYVISSLWVFVEHVLKEVNA